MPWVASGLRLVAKQLKFYWYVYGWIPEKVIWPGGPSRDLGRVAPIRAGLFRFHVDNSRRLFNFSICHSQYLRNRASHVTIESACSVFPYATHYSVYSMRPQLSPSFYVRGWVHDLALSGKRKWKIRGTGRTLSSEIMSRYEKEADRL